MVFDIRPAILSDARLLLEWRNSFVNPFLTQNFQIISAQEHLQWFKTRLSNLELEPFWLLLSDSSPIGYLRFDRNIQDNVLTISIFIIPEFQNQGLGKKFLRQKINNISLKESNIKFRAIVNIQNSPSIKLFTELGFKINRSLKDNFAEYILEPRES